MKRKKNKRITSPVGTAQWPRLNEPDTFFDKEGLYSVGLRLHKDDAIEFIDSLTDTLNDFLNTLKEEHGDKNIKISPIPVKDVMNEDGGPTGEVEIKFKLRAIGKSGRDTWEQRPVIFDSNGAPMTETVGGGSQIKVGAEVVPYYTAIAGAGITLRMKAVQVLTLVEYHKGDSFNSWEFSQEDGFVTNPKSAEGPKDSQDSEEGGFDF